MENIVNIASLSRTFKGSIKKLEGAENIVREVLGQLSRDTLAALHEHGNITFINSLLQAKMTPRNKKTIVLFFRAFTGFHYDENENAFTKKHKTANAYDEKKAAALEHLSDPEWNIWTWAVQNVEVEKKDWTPAAVSKYVESAIKKVTDPASKYSAKYSKADIIAAIFAGGVTAEDIAGAMQAMAGEEKKAA